MKRLSVLGALQGSESGQRKGSRHLWIILLLLIAATFAGAQEAKVSSLGRYGGYSEVQYTDWVRTSRYVPVRDGTQLAVDVFLPAVNDEVTTEALPAVYIHERYHKVRQGQDGQLLTEVEMWAFLPTLLRHGYAVVAADSRGTGASFGSRPQGEMTDLEAQDAFDIIAWIGEQPWSNGRVGMLGGSYTGITQWLAAGTAPPALKAIIPQMAMFDLYSFVYPGGVYRFEFIEAWGGLTTMLDKEVPGAPVDAHPDMSLSMAALQEHRANRSVKDIASELPYRDSVSATMPEPMYSVASLTRFIPSINASNVAVYSIAGWYDLWPKDHALWFANLMVPQRVLFTPFSHQMGSQGWQRLVRPLVNDSFTQAGVDALMTAEHLRFYDYWLKGIDNGIMNEPPVWYYVMGAPAGEAWRSSPTWPLENEVRTPFYFAAGPSGSIASVNDGLLTLEPPTATEAHDDYTVDYTTLGTSTRWQNGYDQDIRYPDLTEEGERSLTYTTAPLGQSLEVTGHPVVHLWATSTAEDGDFFVYLEEVGADDKATYITEGVLRASHRTLSDAPYRNLGLPYHRSFAEDLMPLPEGEPVELVFDLHPTSNIFDAGHRIRVRIVGADADNFLTPVLEPAPTISLYRDAAHASFIDLPVIFAH